MKKKSRSKKSLVWVAVAGILGYVFYKNVLAVNSTPMLKRPAAAPQPKPVNWGAYFPGPSMFSQPPAGFKLPYGDLWMPIGASFTGRVKKVPAPVVALDQSPWYLAEIILPGGKVDTTRVIPV